MPARIPLELKRAKGTLQPCRVPRGAPTVDVGAAQLDPPADLADRLRPFWLRVTAAAAHLRCLGPSDVEAVRLAALALALVDELEKNKRASVNQRLRAQSGAWSALARLGLSPVDRQRVTSAPDDTDDALAEFMS